MEYKCKKCGYKWESRKEKPKCCPLCKQYIITKEDIKLEEKNGKNEKK